MVSRTLARLDVWLAQAEEVLAEQDRHSEPDSDADTSPASEPVQLCFDLGDV
jgi:hypothetical protein